MFNPPAFRSFPQFNEVVESYPEVRLITEDGSLWELEVVAYSPEATEFAPQLVVARLNSQRRTYLLQCDTRGRLTFSDSDGMEIAEVVEFVGQDD